MLILAPESVGQISGQVFYVWFSVFNLFATMLFWAVMTDRFSMEQSERLFGAISLGGTLGAIFGPWLASQIARPLGTPSLLLVASGFLILAVGAAVWLARLQAEPVATGAETAQAKSEQTVIGGSMWEGFRAVFRSPYLFGISVYVLIVAVMATILYFTRLQMVAALGLDTDTRTTVFAQIDFYTQIATFLLQGLVTGHLMKRFGVPVTMALLPLTMVLGFVGLALLGSLAALIVLDAAFKAVQRGVMRPARETLFTTVARSDRYKAKAFIDTFIYRGGDAIGAQTEGMLARLGMGLVGVAFFAVPLAILWMALGLWLGYAQLRQVSRMSASSRSSADDDASGRMA